MLPVFSRGERVLAAVSGGADSVALLLMLAEARDAGALSLHAAHFHHGIRGAAADRDAAFVRTLCERLDVPFALGGADVPALARTARQGLETAARNARRAFLLDAAAHCGATAIATAHHQDDQAETVLMHLSRGAGLTGARAMRARDGLWAKPLLHMTREALNDYLAARGEGYCEDETNACADNPRNALRLTVLPALNAVYPGASRSLARYAEIAAREDDCLQALTDDYRAANWQPLPFGGRLRVAPVHEAVMRRALHALLRETATDASARAVDQLYALARARRGAYGLGNARFERAGDWVYQIVSPTPSGDVPLHDDAALGTLGRMRVTPCAVIPIRDDPWSQAVDAAALHGARLRTRRPGDRIRPLNAPGQRLLSDLFTDRKIDRPLRDLIPLVALGNQVLWAVGVCLSGDAALTPTTKEAVRLTWAGKGVGTWTQGR